MKTKNYRYFRNFSYFTKIQISVSPNKQIALITVLQSGLKKVRICFLLFLLLLMTMMLWG